MNKVVFFACFLAANVFSQDGFDKVLECKSITYYGFDFSHFELYNSEKVGAENDVIKYIPAWIRKFEDLKPLWRWDSAFKKTFIRSTSRVQMRYRLLPEQWIDFEPHSIPDDSIKNIVASYELKESTGVGVVMIVESFNKPEEKAFVNYVFFDIKTRDILWSAITYAGVIKGMGMTRHWAHALEGCYYKFKNIYKIKKRKHKRKK